MPSLAVEPPQSLKRIDSSWELVGGSAAFPMPLRQTIVSRGAAGQPLIPPGAGMEHDLSRTPVEGDDRGLEGACEDEIIEDQGAAQWITVDVGVPDVSAELAPTLALWDGSTCDSRSTRPRVDPIASAA